MHEFIRSTAAGHGPATRTTHRVLPHTSSRSSLEREAAIYRQGKTPVTLPDGSIRAGDSRPGSALLAGRHLGEIQSTFGDTGLDRSTFGLSVTRGPAFAAQALRHAPASVQSRTAARRSAGHREAATQGEHSDDGAASDGRGVVGAESVSAAHGAINAAGAGVPLPFAQRAHLHALTGDRLSDVRVHDDSHSHAAARQLRARAFTLGRSIYFGVGEYRPHTRDGARLLAHETAHAVQQRGAAAPSASGSLVVGSPDSVHEREADGLADAALRGDASAPRLSRATVGTARAMRAIRFTGTAGRPSKIDPSAGAVGTNLEIGFNTPRGPYFDWSGTYTIAGNAGDPFANFRIFPAQVTRSVHENVTWGTGRNRTRRRLRIKTPLRDSIGASVHYDDAAGSPAFAAAGNSRTSRLRDTPGSPAAVTPFANPRPPRTSTRGWFNWGMSFVAYFGARDATVAGRAGFRPLNFVYWNLSVAGNWSTPRGAAVPRVTANGRTNLGKVSSGAAGAFPPMFGGTSFNTELANPRNVIVT